MISSKDLAWGGNWADAKDAALKAEVYVDFRAGPGYDYIPTSVHYKNLQNDDLAGIDATHDVARHKNLPSNAQNLYKPHSDDGMASGYYVFPDEVVRRDMAPDFVKVPSKGIDIVASSTRNLLQQPQPIRLDAGMLLGETRVRQRDAGNRIGILHDPPYTALPHVNSVYVARK